MSTPHPLTDALLKDALNRRATGAHTSAELISDVLVAVESMPQGHGWRWPLASQRRLLPILLVSTLLLSALIGFAIVAGGRVPTPAHRTGDIAYVHATYVGSGSRDSFGTTTLTVRDRRILNVSSAGGAPAPLVAVPGANPRPAVWGDSGAVDRWQIVRVGPSVRWSPDGSRIAFRLENDATGIYLMNRDGTGLHRLVDLPVEGNSYSPFSAGFAWSPDGAQIAFTSNVGGRAQLSLVAIDNGSRTIITSEARSRGASGSIAWSPDGSRLAFARTESSWTTGLIVINADGTGELRLTEAELDGFHLGSVTWSPDGSMIAFQRWGSPAAGAQDGQRTLYVINPDGTGLRQIAGPWIGGGAVLGTFDEPIAWSPDSTLIAALSRPFETISLVAADGSGERVLAQGDYFDWSPDGSQLVFSAPGTPIPEGPGTQGSALYVINIDGTGLRWLAEGEYPDWSPVAPR